VPAHPVRFVTAAALFDGHDAAINIMRRILQAQGAEVVHLGHDRSVREVIEAARDVTGAAIATREAPRRAGDPPMLVASSDRIRSELGWVPRKPELERMIADAWAFIQARPGGYSD